MRIVTDHHRGQVAAYFDIPDDQYNNMTHIDIVAAWSMYLDAYKEGWDIFRMIIADADLGESIKQLREMDPEDAAARAWEWGQMLAHKSGVMRRANGQLFKIMRIAIGVEKQIFNTKEEPMTTEQSPETNAQNETPNPKETPVNKDNKDTTWTRIVRYVTLTPEQKEECDKHIVLRTLNSWEGKLTASRTNLQARAAEIKGEKEPKLVDRVTNGIYRAAACVAHVAVKAARNIAFRAYQLGSWIWGKLCQVGRWIKSLFSKSETPAVTAAPAPAVA